VAQGVAPEFKPQYCKKNFKKKKERKEKDTKSYYVSQAGF
jgi:hypothetical protein